MAAFIETVDELNSKDLLFNRSTPDWFAHGAAAGRLQLVTLLKITPGLSPLSWYERNVNFQR
jgi:hypothetical protein